MKKKFKVEGKFRGMQVNPEVVEIDMPEKNTITEIKERLKTAASLDEVTAFEEVL